MRLRNIPGAREAVEGSEICVCEPEVKGMNWEALFGNEAPIHIEIGMGKGRFITGLAQKNPEINYIGIERYESVMIRALQKLEELPAGEGQVAIPNLRLACCDANDILEIFSEGQVDRIYLNFSDPWPKERHAKRRLTSDGFLEKYKKILSPDGRIEFKTDNRGLFDFSVETINASPLFNISQITYDLHNDSVMNEGNIMTEYEEKFSSKGNPIYKLIATPV